MSDEKEEILDEVGLFEKLIGEYNDKYEFIDEIESESLGRIYRVEDKGNGAQLILKIIEKEKLESGAKDYLLKQIKNEIKILELCRNKSENIIQLLNHFETDLSFILIFENCQTNLKNYIFDEGPLIEQIEQGNTSILKDILSGIVNGLSFLYDNKIIHRNIKPANIYLQEKGDELIPKIADFGVATFESENNYELTGTFAYMAPEIMKKSVYDIKSDMWSIGILFYEIITGTLLYGKNVTKKILKSLFSKNILYFKLTENIQLNILFRRLLVIDPDKRMTFPELQKYISSKDFLKENIIYVNNDKKNVETYNDINKNIEKYNKIKPNKNYLEERTSSSNLSREEQINNVIQFTDLDDIQDIMNYCNGDIDNVKINNIIYYDENASNNISKGTIYSDCEEFDRETNGAFILCSNINSLKYIMDEIKMAREKDGRIKFNLIVTGEKCDKVVIFLVENEYYNIIEKMCIYNINREKYFELIESYGKIVDIFVNRKEVIDDFIKRFSSKDMKPFVITKLLTERDYKDKYYIRHEKIAKYYGEFDEKLFQEAMNKIIEYVSKDKNLKIPDANELIKSLMKFDKNSFFGDIQAFNQLLIKEYTNNTFYSDLNKWLLSLNKNSYEYTAYFTGRLMYCLNSFASKNKKYYNENKMIYRGIKMPYSNILIYERSVGKIIILSSFTSSTLDKNIAIEWSGRNRIEEEYEKKLVFSVMFHIENIHKENWISNGVDIHEVSEYFVEQEVLYLPFSFYYVTKVEINLDKKIADIYLRTCGKKEIIEEKIKTEKEKIIIKEENNEKIVAVVNKKIDGK